MFILGFHFPASEGNQIATSKVVEKLDSANVDMSSVKEIKIYEGSAKSSHVELYKTYTNTDTFMAKALVHFFTVGNEMPNEAKKPKYLVYTNKYQISQLSRELDKDEETQELCRKFNDMEPLTIDVIYS
jgi:hypothetical protein